MTDHIRHGMDRISNQRCRRLLTQIITSSMILQGLQGTTAFSEVLSTSRWIQKVHQPDRFINIKYNALEVPRRRKVYSYDYPLSQIGMTGEKSFLEPGSGPTVVIEPDTTSSEIYSRAITRTLQWVTATAIFGAILWSLYGHDTSYEFFAGYLVEQSLSIDNLFVFLLLFDYFKVPLAAQDRVLNWGIYGAIIMRAGMIGLGSVALSKFHVVLLVFAGILVYSSISALWSLKSDGGEEEGDGEEDMSENKIVQFSRSLIDSTDFFDGDRFFTLVNGVKKATPLFICMIALEISDVVFAVDSIPAVFGVTSNPLVVFSSNMFAIMGLRSLYTVLSKAASDLKYLEPAVAVVLGFIGSKMIVEYFGFPIPTELSLGVVLTLISGGIFLSVWEKERNEPEIETEYQENNDCMKELEMKSDEVRVLERINRDVDEIR